MASVSVVSAQNSLSRHLLSEDEKQAILDYKGFKPFLLLVWALREVEAALPDAKHNLRDVQLLTNFREQAFNFRGHCGQITNWLKLPVPLHARRARARTP